MIFVWVLTMIDFDLNAFLPYRLATAASRVSKAFERRYTAAAGLTVPEWRVLAHLSQESEVSVREIEARVDMEKSKISRAASRLEKQGLVKKVANAGDRRLVSLSLTDQGHALIQKLVPLALEFQKELISTLGPQAEAFLDGLTRVNNAKL
ncbi:MarR family winged helix-turn-helix transcriptional regulator [Paracoccus pacificus]|uniref:MarR family winged helix-turn-helix transcriptional regulator n=1 Tax=Paracoccus pacificus TaxID=1463598 RepID=A0ABW4R7A2_9RHOB